MDRTPRQAFVGLGANLGDRHATLAEALRRLRATPQVTSVESSSIYETDPVGQVNQPLFLNQVAGIETCLSPEDLLRALMAIESALGRVRTERWGPRTLDLDLLAYEGESRDTVELQLPHPRMASRAFVIVPLREVLQNPKFQIPAWDTLRASADQLLETGGVRRVAEH